MILIIDAESQSAAVCELRDIFYKSHIHSLVISPDDLGSAQNHPAKIIVVPRPESISDIGELSERIRSLFPKAALSILVRPTDLRHRYLPYADRVFTDRVHSAQFLSELFSVYALKNNESPYIASFGFVDADLRDFGYITFSGIRFPVRPTTFMLLRYLTLHAPTPISVDELIATCFPPNRPVDPGTVRAYLSEINRILSHASEGIYTPVCNHRGLGYSVR